MEDKILIAYQNAINRIDDYFEYNFESRRDQKFVTKVLEELAEELKKSIMIIAVKKLDPNAKLPTQANPYDAGFDLYALNEWILHPGERRLFRTGLAVSIPPGHYGRIAPRSGLALRYGVDTMAGVVDATYRGELSVLLINLGQTNIHIKIGDRIAQMIIEKCHEVTWREVEQLDETSRGEGFGSSGQ